MLPLEYKNHLITCPMCLGKGYCDEDKSRLSYSLSKGTRVYPKHSLRLPAISSESTNVKRHFSSFGSEFPNSDGIADVHLPTILHGNSSYTGCSRNSLNKRNMVYSGGDNTKAEDKSLLAEPAKFERPQDALKLALLKLKQNQWDSTMQALVNIVQISRFQPELIDSSMPIVNRSICSLLRNIRSNVARTACQVAAELFRTMQCTQRPEFDELIGMLLQKTADMNKHIRQDANRALDAMADFIPQSHCVRVMASSRGAGHKNPLVRTTVSRLLHYIVTAIGIDTFLSTTATKDTRSSVFVMCARFLVDGNSETRNIHRRLDINSYPFLSGNGAKQKKNLGPKKLKLLQDAVKTIGNARTLIKLLMTHNDFERLFNQEVDRKLTEKIKKQLITLKYDTPSGSQIS